MLSARIAKRIAEIVERERGEQKALAVWIAYQVAGNYEPAVFLHLEEDAGLKWMLASPDLPLSRAIDVDWRFLDADFTELDQWMRDTGHVEIGTAMLNNAARILTANGGGQPDPPDMFIAFAMDSHIDFDISKVLVAGGAKPEWIAEYYRRGWLRPTW